MIVLDGGGQDPPGTVALDAPGNRLPDTLPSNVIADLSGALQARRLEQNGESWKKRYACRAGIEGTLSQGVRRFGLRRCRYLGQAETHLHHVFTAAAINLACLDAWLQGKPRSQTRSRFSALAPSAA